MGSVDDLVMPHESAEFIMKHAKSVTVNPEAVEKLSHKVYDALKDKNCNYFNWKGSSPLNPKKMNEFSVNWIFFCDTMNFSFWSDNELMPPELNDKVKSTSLERFTVIYKNIPYHGYWALCAAINRALDEGFPITESNYYAHITEQELKHILRSDSSVQIPLLDLRLKILQETGKILNEEFQGSFLNCIKMANGSAKYLLKLITDYFPSYRDETNFLKRKVTFYKRAQILIADIWGCFEGKNAGYFYDIDNITMFADYRVPQVLKFYDVIDYAEDLKAFLKRNALLTSGARFENEIRAGSIVSCRLLTKAIQKLIDEDESETIDGAKMPKPIINDILVDFYLWNFRVDNANEIAASSLPFHKIRCMFY